MSSDNIEVEDMYFVYDVVMQWRLRYGYVYKKITVTVTTQWRLQDGYGYITVVRSGYGYNRSDSDGYGYGRLLNSRNRAILYSLCLVLVSRTKHKQLNTVFF